MPQKFKGSKIPLGEPLEWMFKDFCAANYNALAIEVIREAVREHIEKRLENPEMKERFEKARKTRLGLADTVVQLVDEKE